jgi:DNA-binding MarR family transcriptional regulator
MSTAEREPLAASDEFEVLQTIRCRGVAAAERIAASTGLAVGSVEAVLTAAEESGFVKLRQGKVSGVSLTPTGRARLVLLTRDSVTSDQLAAIAVAYDAFLGPNRELKSLVTAWQASQDAAAALAALQAVHADVTRVIMQAAAAQPRFRRYQPRLRRALESFRSGDVAALARPLSESYHDVWMELHEDLLTTMGRTRSDADGI